MKTQDVAANIGARVTINGLGDLAMEHDARPYVNDSGRHGLRILKLTKGGKVQVSDTKGKQMAFYPQNVDLLP